jgi:hypothetical protein
MNTAATELFQLPEGSSYPSPEPPAAPPPSRPVASPFKDEDRGGRRDTPTTFYVKPEGGDKPDPNDRVPDSAKTQMLDAAKLKSSSGPSPVTSNPNASYPAKSNAHLKTMPFGVMPDLSNLPPLSPPGVGGTPSPGPVGFGFAPPPAPPSSNPQSGSGVFSAPVARPSGYPTVNPGMMPPQGMPGPGQQGFRPPSMVPQPHPLMTGQNMPNAMMNPMMTGQNMPMMNIPGTTGPLPMGTSMPPPPGWMSTSYQQAPRPSASPIDRLAAIWNNASPKTQIGIAAGTAAGFVTILLLLLWLLVR